MRFVILADGRSVHLSSIIRAGRISRATEPQVLDNSSNVMRYILIVLFILFNLNSFSQIGDTLTSRSNKTSKRVSFIVKVDTENATKGGIFLNGYIVNMDYQRAVELNGKTIKVTGKVTNIKGLENQPKEFNKNGQEIIKGGRIGNAKHILSPKIKIIDP